MGVVGEIYVKYNPFSNLYLTSWLMEEGVEAVLPPMLSFFLQSFVNAEANEDALLDGTASDRKPNSRLSCQILVTEALGGLVVELPERQI